jgi:hypothetical protein
VDLPRQVRRGRRGEDRRERGQLVRCLHEVVAERPQDLAGALEWVEDWAREHLRADRVQPVLERGHDAEVSAPSLQPPEEVGVLACTGRDGLAGGRDDVSGEEVVAGRRVLAREPTEAAAEREAGDSSGGDLASRRGEPELLRLAVEVAPSGPRLRASRPRGGIDADALLSREVDDDAVVADRAPGDIMTAAANGNQQLVLAREVDSGHDVSHAGAAGDQRRPLVDHPVPDPTGRLVLVVAGADQLAPESGGELPECGFV